MYILNEVTSVNTKYIFFTFSDGKQDRKTVNKNDLKELYNDVYQNISNYDFMYKENKKVSDKLQLEIDTLNKTIERQENFIANNQNDPMIKRGFHNVCYDLKFNKRKQVELSHNISGINTSCMHANDMTFKLEKLKRDIESVLKVI